MAKAKKPRAGKRQHPKVKAGTNKGSLKQRKALFAKEFIANGGNKRAAAIVAGYKPGRAADKAGERLSQDVAVIAMIKASRNRALTAADANVDRVLLEATRLALYDPRKFFDAKGALIAPHLLDDDTATGLAGFEVVEMAGGMKVDLSAGDADGESVLQHVPMFTKKVKLVDKNSAVERQMKHLGMFKEDNRQRADALGELLERVDGSVLRPAAA